MSDEPTEKRTSPLVPQVVLFVFFAAFVVIGVLTVLVPEIEDDSNTDEAAEVEEPEPEPEDEPEE